MGKPKRRTTMLLSNLLGRAQNVAVLARTLRHASTLTSSPAAAGTPLPSSASPSSASPITTTDKRGPSPTKRRFPKLGGSDGPVLTLEHFLTRSKVLALFRSFIRNTKGLATSTADTRRSLGSARSSSSIAQSTILPR